MKNGSSSHHPGRYCSAVSAGAPARENTALQTCTQQILEPTESRGLTWNTCLSTLQPRASSSYFMGSSLTQWPHGELEGAAWHWLPFVFDIHSVDPHFLWHKADTVGVFVTLHNFGIEVSPRGTGYLSCHISTINFWREQKNVD